MGRRIVQELYGNKVVKYLYGKIYANRATPTEIECTPWESTGKLAPTAGIAMATDMTWAPALVGAVEGFYNGAAVVGPYPYLYVRIYDHNDIVWEHEFTEGVPEHFYIEFPHPGLYIPTMFWFGVGNKTGDDNAVWAIAYFK